MTIYTGHHKGNIDFTTGDDAYDLLSVTGYVAVREGATFTAPMLTTVTRDVYVYEDATFDAPALTNVGFCIRVCKGATLNAPAFVAAITQEPEQ